MTTTRKFLIDGDADTPQPENSTVNWPEPIGTFIDGTPIYQGYASLEVRWAKIAEASVAKLLSLYDVNAPSVTVQYWDQATQADITKSAKMLRPKIGAHHRGYYDDVSVLFTRLGAS